jgi:anaerobic ribonucleoside-triphosphate reductase
MMTKEGVVSEIQLRDEERTRCEVWTRVMGYFRPVSQFNTGKQSEYAERRAFLIPAGL